MKKTLTVLSTTMMLGLGSFVSIPVVKADTLNNIQTNISNTNSSIAQAKDGLAAVTEQINRVNAAIIENNTKITDTQNKINEKNNEVNQLNGQISDLKGKIDKRNEILKKRAQSLQETGTSVNYLDVVFGATSFRDFVDRVGAVAQLVEADNNLLTQQESDKQALEAKQTSVQNDLSDLTAMKTDLDGMQAELADQKSQQEAQQTAYQQQQQDGKNQLAALMEQAQQAAAEQINAGVQEVQKTSTTSGKRAAASGISALSSAPASVPANGSISTVIQAGYKYIGHSVYVFGGGRTASDIAHGYFDCSGFVHWAFAQAGISVGSSTDSLLGAGPRVSASALQPGDLVFFNTYKTNGHVGIYLGGGNFIGSQSSTGVAVANMSSGYWAQHFAGVAVRVK